MKKIIALLITSVMLTTFLVGCSELTESVMPTPTDTPVSSATVVPSVTPTPTPHTHSYGEWTVTQEPTCTEKGLRACSCSCGDTKEEEIPTIDHNYVNYICTMCKKENMPGELYILDNLDIDELFYCSKNAIIFGKEHKYYLADRSGKILTAGYDSLNCANSDGYFVAYNSSSEIIYSTDDPDFGTLNTVRYVKDCYVIDSNGNIIFSTEYIYTVVPMGKTTYEGEYIASCNENRIITYTSYTYYFASSHSALTVNMYNMQGERLAQFTNVRSVGTLINNELILLMDSPDGFGFVQVVDSNGKILRSGNDCIPSAVDFTYFPNDTWTTDGFIGGYALITDDCSSIAVLIDSTLTKSYIINSEYLANYSHIGTMVASKIIVNGTVSEQYYLIDLTLCKPDENGYCIPSLDAAVSKQGYDDVYLSCLFGKTSPYALVSENGQWGYSKLDGSFEKMYIDAGKFYDGKAIVKDSDGIYIIDENFNRISNIITGYDSVTSFNGDVFCLHNGDKLTVAVYD